MNDPITMKLADLDETSVPLQKRSYIYWALHKPELVGAKIAATRWLLEAAPADIDTVREYMAGVGVQSLIVRERCNVEYHIVADLSPQCAEHLRGLDLPLDVRCEDARKAMMRPDYTDLKMVDYPHSSALLLSRSPEFARLFENSPKAVVWTDTSISYSIKVHGAKYAAVFGVPSLSSTEEYIAEYSAWLQRKFGYSIVRAAIRGRNAVYFIAVAVPLGTPSRSVEIKSFPLDDHRALWNPILA